MKIQIDESDPNTFVVSKLNNKKYTRITHTHTKKYGITIEEYCKKFNLTRQEIVCQSLRKKLSWTKKACIQMYGEREGESRWNLYRKRQAISNTFEYKKKRHGWSQKKFKEYNLSRASTKSNFIKRYGKNIGSKKWEEYCRLQSYNGSSEEYFIEKYGLKKGSAIWSDICKKKSNTLETFINRYGLNEGKKRFQSYMDNRVIYYSAISQELFDILAEDKKLSDDIYYATKNKEYSVYDKNNQRIYFYDFVDVKSKKCIEFNGDHFHGNPELYKEDECPNPFKKDLTCREIWEHDYNKNRCIEAERDFEVLVVWEKDYRENPENIIQKCREFLNYG